MHTPPDNSIVPCSSKYFMCLFMAVNKGITSIYHDACSSLSMARTDTRKTLRLMMEKLVPKINNQSYPNGLIRVDDSYFLITRRVLLVEGATKWKSNGTL